MFKILKVRAEKYDSQMSNVVRQFTFERKLRELNAECFEFDKNHPVITVS